MFNVEKIKANTKLLLQFSKKDFKEKYLGSYLGITWAFIHPTITILILWFVFQVGFKSVPVDDVPFILWLLSGIIAWFFISDCVSSSTGSIVENSFLVKKIVFNISILPVVKVVSALKIHFFFIGVTILIFILYGYSIDIYYLQLVYYLIGTIFLLIGTAYLTSALVVFLKDVSQIVAMVLQFGFWVCPIFWSLSTVPEKYHFLIKLNPVFYIVQGYRDSLINKVWFWEHPFLSSYFWIVSIAIMALGIYFFKKLRPHFADVL